MDSAMIEQIQRDLAQRADTQAAEHAQRFFRTGKGQYGEGDVFLGIRVPVLRKLARTYRQISLNGIEALLDSLYHEQRLLALICLVDKYRKADNGAKKRINDLYLSRTARINNWDLVDISAPHIVGAHLMGRSKRRLYTLARSKNLWERRIAIIATFHFIRNRAFDDTLTIAECLLNDSEDLIHKAVGWMLREVGKRDIQAEVRFLKKHYHLMPRTMLRYAIEKFPEKKRQAYLHGRI